MTPKQQALKDLDEARGLLVAHMQLAKNELNPKVIANRSLREHPLAWLAGAGITGLLLVKMLLPVRKAKIERDNSDASAKKGGLIALILSSVLVMAKQTAWKYGSRYLQTYLTQHFSRHEGERPRA